MSAAQMSIFGLLRKCLWRKCPATIKYYRSVRRRVVHRYVLLRRGDLIVVHGLVLPYHADAYKLCETSTLQQPAEPNGRRHYDLSPSGPYGPFYFLLYSSNHAEPAAVANIARNGAVCQDSSSTGNRENADDCSRRYRVAINQLVVWRNAQHEFHCAKSGMPFGGA
uniref:Uncharacterized protein n=1 Tax=Globodera rostochiensis TaxID=31243 RepID=A0A914I5G9_GLORO